MTIGKREKTLLAVLGIFLYGFLFYKFILIPVMPEIKEKNQQFSQLNQKKQGMDRDIRNIELKKLEVNAKAAENEALDEILVSSANVSDSIEYIDKLSKMMESDLTDVLLSQPTKRTTIAAENSSGENEFYEFKISFKTVLTYDKILELVESIEEGSRKIKINNFRMGILSDTEISKLKTEKLPSGLPVRLPDLTGKKVFSIEMSVNLYAMNMRNADKLYEYSRHRFNDYSKNETDIPFLPSKEEVEGTNATPETQSGSSDEQDRPIQGGGEPLNGKNVDISSADLLIMETSFLSSGHNLQVFGSDKLRDVFGMDTKDDVDIRLKLGDSNYAIDASVAGHNAGNLVCSLPEGDLSVYVSLDFPFIKENENLGICLNISNESNRSIYIRLEDKVSRLKMTDASGNELNESSESQRIYLV